MRTVVGLVVVLVSLSACGGDGLSPPTAVTSPSPTPLATTTPSPTPTSIVTADPTPTLASTCPNEIAARADESLRNRGSLTGDVDGDGTAEEVWTAVDPDGPPGCVGFLVVRHADDSLLSAPLPFETLFGTFDPRMHALVEIGPLAGYEMSVFVGRGASTEFLVLFAVSGDTLMQLKIAGSPDPERSIFGTGGSVGHLDAVDCLEGHIVASSAVPSGESVEYRVKRRDLELQGLVFVRRGKPQRERIDLDELDRYPEFANSPLGSCPQS